MRPDSGSWRRESEMGTTRSCEAPTLLEADFLGLYSCDEDVATPIEESKLLWQKRAPDGMDFGPGAKVSVAVGSKFLDVFRRADKLQLCRTPTYSNNFTPALKCELDITRHIQWDRNQVIGNTAIYP